MRSLLAGLLLSATLSAIPALAQIMAPALSGHITHIDSPTSFKVDGVDILVSSTTSIRLKTPDGVKIPSPIVPYFGAETSVYGKFNTKRHTIAATKVLLSPPDGGQVKGSAIIDKIPLKPEAKPDEMLVRADGYLLLLTPKTKLTSSLSDRSLHGLHTNVWITYHGVRQPSGIILVDIADIKDNAIAASEDHLLAKTDYDPDGVDSKAKQSGVSKYFTGIDPKQIPPYKNEDMQTRIDRIGNSLIPAYQKALPETDHTKIIFRFQLVDEKKWHDAWTLPSGVILVPYQIVEQLSDDSQLATVLADNIACALEKQDFRQISKRNAMTAAGIAGDVAGVFVPGAGLATGIALGGSAEAMRRHAEEQSGRVSLSFLSDAGYDIRQAPLAWWHLYTTTPKDPLNSAIPQRAANLYQTLGSAWSDADSTP